MRAVGGGAMIGFEGPAESEAWRQFYERWFARQGWTPAAAWRASGGAWVARYAAPDGATAEAADLVLAPAGNGRLTGLILLAPK